MDKNKIRLILNILIAAAVPASWLWMALSADGTLASSGIRSLRYFTVLSNILEGVASIVFVISSLARKGEASRKVRIFKYVAAVQVAVTFFTVVFLLVPIWGLLDLFTGPNFFFHFLIPVAAMAEFVFFKDSRPTIAENMLTVIPAFVYGLSYTVNILINGMGGTDPKTTNDWYYFLNWGWGIGCIIFFCIMLIAFLVGLLLRLSKKKEK